MIQEQARPRYGVILSPRDLVLPLDPGGRAEVEIGFGNGEATVRYARSHPETRIFGIEVSRACVLRCARRAAGLENLRLIPGDARVLLRELFRDGALDRVVMNFPCPWPKRRHARRRVTARDFADGLAAVLREGGVFELVTDDWPYALEALEKLGGHPALRAGPLEVNPSRPDPTKYERRWMEAGREILRLTFTKEGRFTVSRRLRGEGLHIHTKCPPDGVFAASLGGVTGGYGDARWSFGRSYEGQGAWLVEAFSVDDEFEQRYFLRLTTRDGGGLVKLDGTAGAFLTPAVRGCLRDAAARLDSREARE